MEKEPKKIVVEFEDGTAKEVEHGCIVELKQGSDEMCVDMLNVSKLDIVRFAYGLVVTVDRMGMMKLFEVYMNGEALPDEKED